MFVGLGNTPFVMVLGVPDASQNVPDLDKVKAFIIPPGTGMQYLLCDLIKPVVRREKKGKRKRKRRKKIKQQAKEKQRKAKERKKLTDLKLCV